MNEVFSLASVLLDTVLLSDFPSLTTVVYNVPQTLSATSLTVPLSHVSASVSCSNKGIANHTRHHYAQQTQSGLNLTQDKCG